MYKGFGVSFVLLAVCWVNCAESVIHFSVNSPKVILSNGRTDEGFPLFTKMTANVGSCYNLSSGLFTCTLPGIYEFDIAFISNVAGYPQCDIRHNYLSTIRVYAYDTLRMPRYYTASASVYLALYAGDVVNLYCGDFEHISKDNNTVFSGTFLRPK